MGSNWIARGLLLSALLACACSEPPEAEPPDTESPPAFAVVSVQPASGAAGVSVSATIAATFDAEVDQASLATSFVVSGVTGTVNWSATTRTATFAPDAPLPANQVITATLRGALKRSAGGTLGKDFSWSFDTNDTIAPTVVSTRPADGAQGIGLSTTVEVIFSEEMDSVTLTDETLLVEEVGETARRVSGAVGFEPATSSARFVPAAPFVSGASYRVTVTTGVKDLAGNALAAQLAFTFAAEVDETPPKVELVTPANGATNVSTATDVRVRFDERLDPATVTAANVRLQPDPGVTVTWDAASRTAVLVPNSLAQEVTYTGLVSGVRDTTGNTLAEPFSWSFTTGRDLVPPAVTATVPVNGATGIPRSERTLMVAFSEPVSQFTQITAARGTSAVSLTSAGYDAATRTWSATLGDDPLVCGAAYTVTVAGVRDLAGNAISPAHSFSFQVEPDTFPPVVIALRPADRARLVPLDATITVAFDEDLEPSTLNGASLAVYGVSGTVAWDAARRTATLTPAAPLNPATAYTVTVGTGIEDLAGNALAAPVAATFRTIAAPMPVSGRTTPGFEGPKLAFDAAGDGIAAWVIRTGDANSKTGVGYSLYSAASGSWSADAVLPNAAGAEVEVAASNGRFAIGYRAADPSVSKHNVAIVTTAGVNTWEMAQADTVRLAGNETHLVAWWRVFSGTTYSSIVSVFDGSGWSAPATLATGGSVAAVLASNAGIAFALTMGNGGLKSAIWTGSGWTAVKDHVAVSTWPALQQVKWASNGTGFVLGWVLEYSNVLYRQVSVWDGAAWRPDTTWSFNTQGSSFTGIPFHLASDGTGYMASWFECPGIPNCVPTHYFSRYEAGAWAPRATLVSGQDASGTSFGLAGRPGGYLFAWDRDGEAVTRQYDDLSGSWSADALLAATPLQQLELAGGGSGFAAILAPYGTDYSRAKERSVRLLQDGAWSAPRQIHSATERFGGLDLERRGGDLVLAAAVDGVVGVREVGSTVSAPVTVSLSRALSGVLAGDRRLAIAADGSAFAAWVQYDRGVTAAWGAHYANGSWSAPMRLGPDAGRLDLVSDGTAFLAVFAGDSGVYARKYSDGTLSALVTLESEPMQVESLAAAAGAGFAATWFKRSLPNWAIYTTAAATSPDGLTWSTPAVLGEGSSATDVGMAGAAGGFAAVFGYNTAPSASVYWGGNWSSALTLGTSEPEYRYLLSDGTTFHLLGTYRDGAPQAWRYDAGTWVSMPLPTTGTGGNMDAARNGDQLVAYYVWSGGSQRANLVWDGASWTSKPATYVDSASQLVCDGSTCLAFRSGFVGLEGGSTLDDSTPLTPLLDRSFGVAYDSTRVSAGPGRFGALFLAVDPADGAERLWAQTGF